MILLNHLERQLTTNVLTSLERHSKYVAERVETVFKDVYINNSAYLLHSDIVKLNVINYSYNKYEYYKLINTVRSHLNNIVASSPFVESASIYYENLGTVFHSTHNEKVSYEVFDPFEYETISTQLRHSTISYYENPISHTQELSMLLATNGEYSSFILELIINTDEFYTIIDEYENEKFIMHLCNSFTLTNLTKEEEVDYQNNYNNQANQRISLGGNSYFIHTVTREYGNVIFIGINNLTEQLGYVEHFHYFFGILLIFTFIAFALFIKNISHLIKKEYENEILIQKSELKQLQAQINPHFFYNTFFILQRMIKSEYNLDAQRLAQLMGQYFEYLTKNSEELVPLEEEFQHCTIYLDIQMVRFGNRITFYCDELSPQARRWKVPKLIIQPIIENSFQYGLHNVAKEGILEIHCYESTNQIIITIEDNGQEVSEEQLFHLNEKLHHTTIHSDNIEMTGIHNIHRRLLIYSNNTSKITITRSKLGGLCTSIILTDNHPQNY